MAAPDDEVTIRADRSARSILQTGFGPILRSLGLRTADRGQGYKVYLEYQADFSDRPPRRITLAVDIILEQIELSAHLLAEMPNRHLIPWKVVERLWE